MDGHRPDVWCSDRYAAQQGHANAHQTCLAHLARDVAYADEASEDMLPSRLKRWLQRAFALPSRRCRTFAASTIVGKRRALERSLGDILATTTSCDLARDIQNKFRRARDQLLTFAQWPGMVDATNNACERALRPAVVQRKITNGYRAMWAVKGEADIRTVVDTARLAPGHEPLQNHPSNYQRLKSAMTEPATLIFRASLRARLYRDIEVSSSSTLDV
jgi:transposase